MERTERLRLSPASPRGPGALIVDDDAAGLHAALERGIAAGQPLSAAVRANCVRRSDLRGDP